MSTASTATNTFVASPSPNTLCLSRANQPQQIGFRKPPRAFDAPPIRQRERKSRPSLLRLNRHFDQFYLPFQPPVVERADRNPVLGAVLAPRHPAGRVAFDDPSLFFPAGHAAIVRAF